MPVCSVLVEDEEGGCALGRRIMSSSLSEALRGMLEVTAVAVAAPS
jgi:hypothetical protein